MNHDIKEPPHRFQPSDDPKRFYQQVRNAVLAPVPYLANDHWYLVKDLLLGTDFWNETDNGVHIRAGRSFAWMVRKGVVPFKVVPRQRGQTGARYYLYVGTEIYQGGDKKCQQEY